MIKLITDSGTNFPEEYLRSHPEIDVLHLSTFFNGEDVSALNIEEFYELGFSTEILPKTSQISPQRYYDCFKKYADADAILYISLASGLSGTYNSACLAKQMLSDEMDVSNIYIFDSETACCKQSLMVDIAYNLIQENKSIDYILDKLESAKKEIIFYAVIENLDFLCKGGRLSKSAAIAGGMLGIRSIITVEEGKVKVLQKIRGGKKTIDFLMSNLDQENVDNMFIICGKESKDFESFRENLTVSYVEERIQKTIGVYTGPSCFGYAYIKK